MRIISGKWKGKRLLAPKNLPTRPTTDFAKEGLFNILSNRWDLNRLEIMDLFAGIGSFSWEILSREAANVVMVEKHHACIKFLNKTAESLAFHGQVSIIQKDVFEFLPHCKEKFDLIFADPPFDLERVDYQKLIDMVMEQKLLKEEGEFILEHNKEQNFENHPSFFQTRKYGVIHFTWFIEKK